jgi:adenosylcobinamide-GDP ribazoletransferase
VAGNRISPGTARDGLRLALGTLTALPVPPPAAVDRSRAGLAMALAPLVALLPGTATALVAATALWLGLDPLVAAALALGTLALSTRGLHLDGLADTADGLAASYDRARALEVMRRGNSGPAGVASVVLLLAVQFAAMAQALRVVGPAAVVVAVVAGRLVLPLLCARGVPAARPEGLGAAMAGSVPRALVAAVALTVVGGAGLALAFVSWQLPIVGRAADQAGPPAPGTAFIVGASAVAVAALVAGLLGRRAVRRFGGVTGDVLGAGVEAGTAAALVVLAACPLPLAP